ncbi:MAG: MFS transporter [Chloroflexota bacterium]
MEPQPTVQPPQHVHAPPGLAALLRDPRFLSLWGAQIVSQVAGNAALYALTILVFSASGQSNAAVSFLFLAFLVPAVVLSPPAGVLVDRVDRRHVLIASNAVRAVAYGAIVLLPGELSVVLVAVVVAAAATTLFIPAEAAMIPRVAPPGQLLAANGLFTFTLQAAFAAGFALVGPLCVAVAGAPMTIALTALLYVLATLLCVPLPAARPAADEARRSATRELREGLAVIRHDPHVRRPLVLLAYTASIIGVIGVVAPAVAVTVLGLTEEELIVLVLPVAAGLLVGIALLALLGRRLSRRALVLVGLVGLAGGLTALALLEPLGALAGGGTAGALTATIPVAIVIGAAYALVAASAQTILQESLDDVLRGRVFAVLNAFVSAASAVPLLVVGVAADAFGVPVVIGACALGAYLLLAEGVRAARQPQPVA